MVATFSVLTAAHTQDIDRFALLRTSMIGMGLAEEVDHVVVVHTEDVSAFRRFAGQPRLRVVPTRDVLEPWLERRRAAGGYRRTQFRHYVPGGAVSGWFTQQVAKLALAAESHTEAVLVLDSDMVQISPLAPSDVLDQDGRARLFVSHDMRDDGSEQWNRTAGRMLGVPEDTDLDEQYIQWPTALSRSVVRALLDRLTVRGRTWQQVMHQHNAFEYPTYGVWARHGTSPALPASHPLPFTNFSEFDQLWDFRREVGAAIATGESRFLAVQSRLHIPASSYEQVVSQAWSA